MKILVLGAGAWGTALALVAAARHGVTLWARDPAHVLAIATGLCDGLELGLNARAALVTRGLAEMTRFGIALGARPETFMGLSGLGDLVLTATSAKSRNARFGVALGQ